MGIEALFPPFAMVDYICCGVAVILVIFSWFQHVSVFSKVKPTNHGNSFSEPVSVIVVARNELQNLQKNLPMWFGQDYPNFELIIADDGSTDGSAAWIIEQVGFHSNLKLVHLDPEYVKMHGKKIALTLAFKKAMHRHFVLTDADCSPASEQWLRGMTAPFAQGKDIVLGFSPYEKRKGLLNAMIRYETAITALNYIGYAMKGNPYMGVGRNLAYSRNVYDSVQGFARHSHIPAGDDDLFVQSAATANNTAVCLEKSAYTISIPKTTFAAWRRQKRRHLWVGKFYDSGVRNMLAVYPLVQILLFFCLTTWMVFTVQWWYPLALLLLKILPEWIIKSKKFKVLQSGDLSVSIPFLGLLYMVFYTFSGIGAFFAKKPKW